MKKRISPLLILLLLAMLVACTQDPSQPLQPAASPGKLKVVATTTIVGDVVQHIGGQAIQLNVLLPVNADPHSFQPTPQDAAKVAEAQVIFVNGAGLEAFLSPLLENAGSQVRQVSVSQGISLHSALEEEHEEDDPQGDPHVWMDPNNVMVWVKNIAAALSEADPQNATLYQNSAEMYLQNLDELDLWIRQQVDQIPEARRVLVTDHQVFGYFAERYGFQQLGAVIPGYSTMSQPSAQELAALEDSLRSLNVPAIFVGNTIQPNLVEQVSNDTGTQLLFVYTGSLTDASGPAATYLDYMRFNVNVIVSALK